MITIDKLKKNFGEKGCRVDIEHYEINQGDMLGLVGNNKCKQLFSRLMLDLLKADDGKVIINDG